MRARILILAAIIATAAVYWPGLSGPFIFDDNSALEVVHSWYKGNSSWQEVVWGNAPLMHSRPAAMASFLASTWLGGPASLSFKLGNLVIHLICGLLIWRVSRQVFLFDRRSAPQAELLSVLVASVWLLHPLHVSTVLYAVQRMAQLATLFSLAAVLTYVAARNDLVAGRVRPAIYRLFMLFPLLLLAGLMSKQNAAATPLMCLALEGAFFSRQVAHRRTVNAFFLIFLAIPVSVVVVAMALWPGTLLAGYNEWDFTLTQRLLTQPRALFDYIGMLLVPRGPLMGLYTDDFAVSTGLLTPLTTLCSIAALVFLTVAATRLRKRIPLLFAGWFFYLAAMSVESTFLPIEMYYEHRNYLPSVGIFIAVIGIVLQIPKTIKTNMFTIRQLGLIATTGILLALSYATFARVLIWQDASSIAHQAIRFHPDSLRANFHVGDLAIGNGNPAAHREIMRKLANSASARNREMANMEMAHANCRFGIAGSPELMNRAIAEKLERVTVYETYMFSRLSYVSRGNRCLGMTDLQLANYMSRLLESASDQPESATPKQMTRYILSEIYARSDRWNDARHHAELAWLGGRNSKIGALLVRIYVASGELGAAGELLHIIDRQIPNYDRAGQEELLRLRNLIAQESN